MPRLQLSQFQRKLVDWLRGSPGPAKFPALNAVRGLGQSWKLRKLDPEIAVFRAMTAEEESAVAIFRALQFRQYPAAKKLNPSSHPHKAAVHQFLLCVEHALASSDFMALKPQVVLKATNAKAPLLLRLKVPGPDGKPLVVTPVPPLGGQYYVDGQKYDFGAERRLLLSSANVKSMEQHLQWLGNERNRLLYASTRGLPAITNLKDHFFTDQRERIFRNLTVASFIVQEPRRQLFVEQALEAFVDMMGRLGRT